ncbi:NACHT, LRR and PYD domains-containing protein 1 homolog [Colossoma macropomum]|uniref:NACHT, LRR and PYD domains-containing protein 1 homolog n=1 Tax=Colossoma macropomum TaxID=42526 RepID=UPI0018650187|nr:NACHT, LRR and PYD domains-containing protein 1 homolog [Colossoma macropomum]
MEEDRGYVDNSFIRAGDSRSSGLNINMHVGSGARVFAPILSNVQARDVTFAKNDGGASLSGGEIDITSVIAKYKKSLVAEHACIREYTSLPGQHVQLLDRYVDPLIIQRHKEKKEKKKEICSKGEDFHHARTHHTDHHITVDKLFSQEDSPNSMRPKAVILQGNSGSGKSFTAQKILYDWANGNLFAGIFDVVFHLRCSELNDIAGDISLVELLNCSEEMAQILKKTPERVLFLLDGFDELRLSLPKKPLPVKADIKAGLGAVLSSLLRGCMLNESFLLVTTRSVAAEKLGKLLKHPQRFTEIMGFSENGIQQYFQMFFKHDGRSRQVYGQVKANGTLYSACSSPVMCWLICSVFKEKSKMSKRMTRGFRSTTSIFVDFVFILLEHHCQGLTESQQRDLLKDLGQLAHKGILKGRVLFQRNQVPETILNVLDSTRIPFLCTFHCKDRINVKEMFSFMHLSFQEFFAALLYTFLDETEAKLKLEKLLTDSLQGGYHCLPIVQFLFGLSNKAVKSLLMEKHQQAVSCTTCAQLQEWLYKFVSRKLNMQLSSFTLQCLCEVNDKYIVEKAMKIWETNGVEIQLSSSDMTDYHAAAQCLQFCRRIRSLKLQGSTVENLKMLHTTLNKCDKLHLSVSYVSDIDVADLISAVGKGKDLQCLSVEDGDLSDQSVKGIMSALRKRKSVNSVHLSVKTINYTNAEIFMNIVESNLVSNNLSVATNCRNSEENICSDLELSGPDMFHRIYVCHPSWNTYDLHIDSGKSGQTFKSICLSCGDFKRVMSPSEWRKFLQISSNLKQIENHEFHGHMEELVSFLKSGPESWPTVHLDAKSLSQKCAAKILSFCHATPALNSGFDSCWFNVESLKGMDEEDICSLSLQTHCSISILDGVLCLDLKAHAWSPHTTQSTESTPVLREISLRFPVISEGANVDWEDLLRRLCQMRKSLERQVRCAQ